MRTSTAAASVVQAFEKYPFPATFIAEIGGQKRKLRDCTGVDQLERFLDEHGYRAGDDTVGPVL